MQPPHYRTLAELERQMAAARQLRSETVRRGTHVAVQALTGLLRRTATRWRGAPSLSAASWLIEGFRPGSSRR